MNIKNRIYDMEEASDNIKNAVQMCLNTEQQNVTSFLNHH